MNIRYLYQVSLTPEPSLPFSTVGLFIRTMASARVWRGLSGRWRQYRRWSASSVATSTLSPVPRPFLAGVDTDRTATWQRRPCFQEVRPLSAGRHWHTYFRRPHSDLTRDKHRHRLTKKQMAVTYSKETPNSKWKY